MKVAVVVFAVVLVVAGRPKPPPGHEYDRYALKWLAKTGWYPDEPSHVDAMPEDNVEKDVHKYLPAMQDFYHTGGNGVMNEKTLDTMRGRNCANKDHGGKRRSKRYSSLGGKWPNGATVTIGFEKYLSGLTRAEQIDVAKGCAKMWGDVSSLKFRLVDPRQELANILITHERMDGPQGSVGWGQSPRAGGTSKIALDESDTWKPRQLSSDKRASVYEEALCHEMGHSLGLGHSEYTDALMYQRVGSRNRNTRLHRDDINGIQSRYGPNNDGMSLVGSSVSTPPVSQPDPVPQPDPMPMQPSQPRTSSTSGNSYRVVCSPFGCFRVYDTNSPTTRTTSTQTQSQPSNRRSSPRTRFSFPGSVGDFNFFG